MYHLFQSPITQIHRDRQKLHYGTCYITYEKGKTTTLHCKKQDPPLQNNALNTQEKWTYMTQNGIELFQIQ